MVKSAESKTKFEVAEVETGAGVLCVSDERNQSIKRGGLCENLSYYASECI